MKRRTQPSNPLRMIGLSLLLAAAGAVHLLSAPGTKAQALQRPPAAGKAQAAPERTLPPLGIAPTPERAMAIQIDLNAYTNRLNQAFKAGQVRGEDPDLPDLMIHRKAVEFAFRNGEFFSIKDMDVARAHMKTANQRLDDWLAGRRPWKETTGLVVRGYRSRIDGSMQPYGLWIDPNADPAKAPVYVWLHGRADKQTDLQFIQEREKSKGKITPPGSVVIHPFGRYCNGFKFAGEIDVLEAVEDFQRRYGNGRKPVLWGFSMGGAGAWHIGAHYPDRWAAVSPGAGFVDTARYNNLKPENFPPPYEQTLWRMYDVPGYVRNLLNVPVAAYSGENDKQMLAARTMEEAFAAQGEKLEHLIGPGMGHEYHAQSLKQLLAKMAQHAEASPPPPVKVHLQTATLRYSRVHWVQATGLGKHWEDSRIDADVAAGGREITLATKNITAIRLHSPPVAMKDGRPEAVALRIDGQKLDMPMDHWPIVPLEKTAEGWRMETVAKAGADAKPVLKKRPGLQGPIDDAFMDSFLVVAPSLKARHDKTARWTADELARLKERWRLIFRGDVQVKLDSDLMESDIAGKNLILFGDDQSNAFIKRILPGLPLTWNAEEVKIAGKSYPADDHLPVLIYPNPLNPERYIVLNSGFTFRPVHDRTNSQQTPKLPDWAVIKTTPAPVVVELEGPRKGQAVKPADPAAPRVEAAGFFDERWK